MAAHTPVFASKAPYAKPGGRIGLNFRGRGREPSPKNMQIGNGSVNDTVLLQMVKQESDLYCVDFSAPFTLLHAFAFGLAQVDL